MKKSFSYQEAVKLLEDLANTCRKRVVFSDSFGITMGKHTDNEIVVGVQNLCDPHFNIDPLRIYSGGNQDVPIVNMVSCIITLCHEKQHEFQVDNMFKKDCSERSRFIALDYIGSISSRAYYEDEGRFDHNYLLMAHELDAEETALVNASYYLSEKLNISFEESSSLVVSAVNTKLVTHYDIDNQTKYTLKYWISPKSKEYVSLNEIIDDFDSAFKNAMIEKRRIYNSIASEKTDFKNACLKDLDAYRMLVKELSGYRQSQMIACIAIKNNPDLLYDCPILKGVISEYELFNRELHIQPPFWKRMTDFLIKHRIKDEDEREM